MEVAEEETAWDQGAEDQDQGPDLAADIAS